MPQWHVRGLYVPMSTENSPFRQSGWIPGTDLYSVQWWSQNLVRSPEFVNDKCAELGVSYRRFGDVIFYAAGDIAAAMPLLSKETDPKRQHGGPRTKNKKKE